MSVRSIKVTELSSIINEHVDDIDLSYFWLEGEIQNFRGSSKHYYFTLNDGNCSIKAIIWESSFRELGIEIKNGLKGLFYGKLNYYENKNELSFIIYKVKLENKLGNIYAKLEQNKRYCIKNGFFDKIPANIDNINRIGIITRYKSAAYNDLINCINNCYGTHVYIYDSGMQGIKSMEEIISGIRIFNKISNKLDLDCIIITRGGGSKEDLWVFNETKLVEAAFNSKLPIITGIGHEIDSSLIDLVADKSCITPTDIGNYICENKSLDNKLENFDYIEERMRNKLTTLYNLKITNINNAMNSIDTNKVISAVENKITNLEKYKRLIEKKLKDYYINKFSTLNYIKSDLDNILSNVLNVKLFRDNNLIIDPEELIKGKVYKLEFNKKVFKIKVV